jgi:Ser/Thr protein kinase RdoA (MazF antagonist)
MRIRADHPGSAIPLPSGPLKYPDSMTPDATPGTSAGPASRVGTSLPALVGHVAADYRLGQVDDWSVLATGYEDCNIDLRAEHGRVVVKVFAAGRPDGIAQRTADVIAAVRQAGARHPRLHADAAGRLVHRYDGHQLLVMGFAAGRTYYDLGRPPDQAELARVVEQAVRIHACDLRPEPVFDSWAIANLTPLAGQVGDLLDARQRRLVDGAIAAMARVDFWSLPVTLIHADLTAGNVLLGPDGAVTVLDLALANRWPRLQELAVIAASLLHGAPGALPERLAAVARLYSAAETAPTTPAPLAPGPLTPAEEAALPAFGRAAAAMELLGGLSQWRQGNRGPETDLLVEIGTNGLRDYE